MTASEIPKIVHLTYELEDGSWSAESEQLPSLFAGGDSLDDAKSLARQVVREELGDSVTIIDWMPVPKELEPVVASRGDAASKPFDARQSGPIDFANPLGVWSGPTAAA